MSLSVFKGHLTDEDWTAGCIQQDWSVSHTRENERFFEDRLSQNNLLTNSASLIVPDVFLVGPTYTKLSPFVISKKALTRRLSTC